MEDDSAEAPNTATPMTELRAVRIPMRDGAELVADVFVPRSGAPCPLILEATPYTRGRNASNFSYEAPLWVRLGYAFGIVDVRGQGDSIGAGRFELWNNDGRDCHDAIEWLAAQPWCDGRVGMRGASYTGTNQWYAAREHPPHLRVLVPNATGTGGFDDIVYPGGVFHFRWALAWFGNLSDVQPNAVGKIAWDALLAHRPLATADVAAVGRDLPGYRTLLDHPLRDSYMRGPELSDDDYAGIDLPTLAFSGWFDGTLRGTLQHFRKMRALSPARERQWLVVGPWEHGPCSDGGYDFRTGAPVQRVGVYDVPANSLVPAFDITHCFYDAFLKQQGNAFDRPHASLYITGSNTWLHTSDYPPPGMRERALYLRSGGCANGLRGDGGLSFVPADDEPSDHFAYDPLRPVPSEPTDQASGARLHGPQDLASLIDRPDVLVYASQPLTESLTICGDVELRIYITSDAPDTDFVVRLEDVADDGRAMKLGSRHGGVVQARSRGGFDRETLLLPGEPAELRIALHGMGHTFLAGHRLRLSLTSSAYPEAFPNPNTGKPRATDMAEPRVAMQAVLHDPAHPSHLVLPVIATPAEITT